MAENLEQTADSYDRVAATYAQHFVDELSHKPLDRALLSALIELAGTSAPIADIGCGFYDRPAIEAALVHSGFEVEMSLQRRPYEPYEFPSQRAYILARSS